MTAAMQGSVSAAGKKVRAAAGKKRTGAAGAKGRKTSAGSRKKRRVVGEARPTAPAAGKAASRTASAKVAPSRGKKARALPANPAALLERFAAAIPDPHVELAFGDPWQLLVAVILSAQSTDRNVNRVTPVLFRRWPTPEALAQAPQEEVEAVVKSTGFFRVKAKSIRGASQLLVERFGGRVPRTLDELIQVPGVARKTANVVLGAAYGITSGIVTDTHAMRVAQRLGLTQEQTPEKLERDLCRQFPESSWIALSHQLVLHGRHWCTARSPRCAQCAFNELCPARQAAAEASWQARAAAEAELMDELSEGFSRAVAVVRASDETISSGGSNEQ